MKYERRRDSLYDGVLNVVTWLVFLAVGIGIGICIGYWQWYEATP